jgi:hypothetical protein
MSKIGWGEAIDREVDSWSGVEARPHRFGGREYRVGRREIGHVHGDHLVDVPLPRRERDRVVREGRAEPHHILPESGWVSLFLRRDEDVARAIELLRLSYDLALDQKRQRLAADPVPLETLASLETRRRSAKGDARP